MSYYARFYDTQHTLAWKFREIAFFLVFQIAFFRGAATCCFMRWFGIFNHHDFLLSLMAGILLFWNRVIRMFD